MDRKQKVLELMKEVQKLNLKLENKIITKQEATEKLKIIYKQIEQLQSEEPEEKQNKKEIEEKKQIEKLKQALCTVQDYALICLDNSENIDFCKNLVKAVNFIELAKQLF